MMEVALLIMIVVMIMALVVPSVVMILGAVLHFLRRMCRICCHMVIVAVVVVVVVTIDIVHRFFSRGGQSSSLWRTLSFMRVLFESLLLSQGLHLVVEALILYLVRNHRDGRQQWLLLKW